MIKILEEIGALENLSYKMYQNRCMNPCWADSYWKTERCVYCSFQFWCRVQKFYKACLRLVVVQNWDLEAYLYKPFWLYHSVPCKGFLYFCGTRQLTNQQIYIIVGFITVYSFWIIFDNIFYCSSLVNYWMSQCQLDGQKLMDSQNILIQVNYWMPNLEAKIGWSKSKGQPKFYG